MAGDRAVIDDQIAYYRARAAEYDATTTPDGDPYGPIAQRHRDALRAAHLHGRVMEIAAGTGQWTALLADGAEELVALDASPEMLALNAAKVADRRIEYRVADAFALEPTQRYDVVFFGFFLSHVPPTRFDAFWDVVAGQLAPGGRAVFVDEADHGAWDEDWIDRQAGVVRRRLTDGSEHRAIKVLWRADDLERRLTELGWSASVRTDGPFYLGFATREAPAVTA
jgi:SAM-dependent methyltransferase